MTQTVTTLSDQRTLPLSLSWFGLSRMTWHNHAFRPAKRPTSHLIADILGLTEEGRTSREEEDDVDDAGSNTTPTADDKDSEHLPYCRHRAFCEHLHSPSTGNGHISTSGGSVNLSVVGCLMSWSRIRLPPGEASDTGMGSSCAETSLCTPAAEVTFDARTQEGKFSNEFLLYNSLCM